VKVKVLLLAAVIGILGVLKRRRASADDLWRTATDQAPDLR
jgi:hypothetical protein